MIDESLIEFIHKEIRISHGEVTIAKSIFSQRNEELQEPKTISDIISLSEISGEFFKTMNYNEGKFDAYHNILKYLGKI
jgi:hypothetical protein